MKILALMLWLACALAPFGCARQAPGEPPFDDIDVPGHDTNPDGVAYPTADVGGRARKGTIAGSRIPNFTFQGYPDSDRSRGLQTVSLADLYDPGQQRHKLLHVMAAVAWCPHCAAQTQAMVQAAPQLREAGLVILQTLMEAPDPSRALTLSDLGNWIDRFGTPFTVVFDVEGRRLSTIANLEAVPWNAFIDTRTMEILDAGLGEIPDYPAQVQGLLQWVEHNPACD